MQHDGDMLRLSNLRVVEYVRQFTDLRRGLRDLLRPALMRSRDNLSGDFHMSGFDDMSQYHL